MSPFRVAGNILSSCLGRRHRVSGLPMQMFSQRESDLRAVLSSGFCLGGVPAGLPAEQGRNRRRRLRAGLTQVVGHAIAVEAGLVVIAGDLFGEPVPKPADLGAADDDLIPLGVADPNDLAVKVPLTGGKLMINVTAVPRPFSPNGDGVNDITRIHYDLTRLVGAAPIAVRVFDLAGDLVRTLFAGAQGGGSFAAEWDGADAAGNKVPPGIYLFRVELNTDAKEEAVVGVVEMVY